MRHRLHTRELESDDIARLVRLPGTPARLADPPPWSTASGPAPGVTAMTSAGSCGAARKIPSWRGSLTSLCRGCLQVVVMAQAPVVHPG